MMDETEKDEKELLPTTMYDKPRKKRMIYKHSMALLWYIVQTNLCAKVWVVLTGVYNLLNTSMDHNAETLLKTYVCMMFFGTFWYSFFWSTRREIQLFMYRSPKHYLSGCSPSLILFFASIFYLLFSYAFWFEQGENYALMITLCGWNLFIGISFFLTMVLSLCSK